jgi:hypothetical protein
VDRIHCYVKGMPSFNGIFNVFKLADPFHLKTPYHKQLKSLFVS